MKKILLCLLALACSLNLVTAQNYEFKNGNWYNGEGFTSGAWYVSKGVFSKKAPSKIDSVIDLRGQWVVPPMGDAFCSSVADNPSADNTVKLYSEEGIFYLQVLSNTLEGRTDAQKALRKNGAPDATYANGGFTCNLGYPFIKFEAPAQGIRNPQMIAERYGFIKEQRKMLGNGYWFIDSKDALEKNWIKVREQKPDVISIYLLDSQNSGGKESKGLTPDIAKLVVKKAHKSGLRVYAHVETADDVRLGLKLGVDGFANIPGYNWDGTGDTKKYELTEADLKQLAKKKTVIIPLLAHGQTIGAREAVQQFHAKILKQLLDKNLNMVIGSDDVQRTTRSELNYWYTVGYIEYPKILKVLCENTPRAIFPKRKVGKIADGFEASFLVLSDNPINNILKLRASSFKVKNGQFLK
ncbi:MAG: hypothetical protein KA165_09990 [Saprospiraceae bacterium]|nr:hypothetical protein [Saprospiraceae bacterium]